ncbi:MAG: DUF4198 domain-containing protein [Deltaproteobacteria bacterium]|nr:DUF4198 domain-containing protein [Deltaproteobacteria bacterium]
MKTGVLLLFFLVLTQPLIAGGIKGRVAWRGELVPGIRIHAYTSIDSIAQNKSVAVSQPAAQDGTYQLELPAGRYYLVARSYVQEPAAGDYFCYYSGAPVVVSRDEYRQVGFNLIQIPPAQPDIQAERSGLRGEITFQGQLLERTYLYVYKQTDSDFKGPAWFVQPVEKGRFHMSLPAGDYWLLARKRLQGGQYGPIERGDYFNFYYGNPVHIASGQQKYIQLETITRLSMLEDEPGAVFRGIRGKVLNAEKLPVAGLRVFAYRSAEMSGTPAYISAATDIEGRFELPVPESGHYWLLARQQIGGPAASDELYGRLQKPGQAGLELSPSQNQHEVTLYVEPHP